MSKESTEFKRFYLLKQPEFATPRLIQGFLRQCEERRECLRISYADIGNILNIRPNRAESILKGETWASFSQYVKLAYALGCHIEMRLVHDEIIKDRPEHYKPKPGGPDHGLRDVPADIGRHPLAHKEYDE